MKSIILVARGFPVNFYREGSISLTHSIIDPIYTEIIVLLQYLVNNSHKLKNKLYLLGFTPIPDLQIKEETIISSWINYNKLSIAHNTGNIWNNFDIHPLEDKLRVNFLKDIIRSKPNSLIP